MASGTPQQPGNHPEWRGSPLYGYDSPAIQDYYSSREAEFVAAFFLPNLRSGMSLLDCGCGPGTITLGLAEAVAPGRVIGIDIEPGMVERAISIASERGIENVEFRVADIGSLPFDSGAFDAVFTASVLEHLPDPTQALVEIFRVLKPGGSVGVVSTEWSQPLISPPSRDVEMFFELFERGFNDYGGSLNRGRHLRSMMRQAGFDVVEFSAAFGNATTPEAVQRAIDGYIGWMENVPVFAQATELGWVDEQRLSEIKANMRKWAEGPDAFLATARCDAVGRKG